MEKEERKPRGDKRKYRGGGGRGEGWRWEGGFGSQMRSAADVRRNASQEGKINIHAVSAECDEIILSTEQGDILVAPTHLGCCIA